MLRDCCTVASYFYLRIIRDLNSISNSLAAFAVVLKSRLQSKSCKFETQLANTIHFRQEGHLEFKVLMPNRYAD